MKKLLYLIIVMVVLGLIISGCDLLPVVPTAEKDEISSLTKAKPGTDFSGPHYNLNLIGKKADWSGGGSYDNWDRHTMFVPEDTSEYTFQVGNETAGYQTFNGIKILMTQGIEFAVKDGNAFDDGKCSFQLAPGEYNVYIIAKAKPGGYTDITGWVYAEDETGAYNWFLNIGTVHVTKSKKWEDATHIFYVSDSEDPFELVGAEDMWVFYYMSAVEVYLDDPLTPEGPFTEYFWQYDNNGNKLVQVRFYPD